MGMSLKLLGSWALITFIAFEIGKGSAGNYQLLLIWLVVSGVAYVASLFLHPSRPCWTCGGKGRHSGYLWDYASRACTSCGGSGRKTRFGVRLTGRS